MSTFASHMQQQARRSMPRASGGFKGGQLMIAPQLANELQAPVNALVPFTPTPVLVDDPAVTEALKGLSISLNPSPMMSPYGSAMNTPMGSPRPGTTPLPSLTGRTVDIEAAQDPKRDVTTKTYNVVKFLQKGTPLWKHKCSTADYVLDKQEIEIRLPYDFRMFTLNETAELITWPSKKKLDFDYIPLTCIEDIRIGQGSKGFKKRPVGLIEHLSFTIVHSGGKQLDLICTRQTDFIMWTQGLMQLVSDPFNHSQTFQVTVDHEAERKQQIHKVSKKKSFSQKSALVGTGVTSGLTIALGGAVCVLTGGAAIAAGLLFMGVGGAGAGITGVQAKKKLTYEEIGKDRMACIPYFQEEIHILLQNPVFINHRYMRTVRKKMAFISSKYDNCQIAIMEEDWVRLNEEVFQGICEAQALFFYLRVLKRQLKRSKRRYM